MKIVKLPKGERPPLAAAFIELQSLPSGRTELTGAISYSDSAVMVREDFDEAAMAEHAGLAWAQGRDVDTLYVVTLDA